MFFTPTVSIIALCYNHEKFIEASIQSVLKQSYQAIELIIMDDCSTDDSRNKILAISQKHPSIKIIFNERNLGNCKSFNQALKYAKGKYIIDLATDDILLPERVRKQVEAFENATTDTGVVFSNLDFIDENATYLKTFYKAEQNVPSGDIYEALIRKSFILPSSMMIKKEVFDELKGYDETLAYEDFDFWIRSSRNWKYKYLPEILTQQRIVSGSLSTKFIQKKNHLVPSTVQVCKKILALNRSASENKALVERLHLVLRQCVFSENFDAGNEVIELLQQLNGHNFLTYFFTILNTLKIPINRLYLTYRLCLSIKNRLIKV
ncbi:glycosyltransferase family 2 protein [Arcicella rigui]|uniref:Glycosyltransferase n=1 Tax=Arcicella rigui TaxID=797020 RepID=A0ABU5QFD4_9BACT|nr:glycosyltransferase [Arcicella rigui]MEA5141580.1 glycosyltransferase [Arcicella rigui]